MTNSKIVRALAVAAFALPLALSGVAMAGGKHSGGHGGGHGSKSEAGTVGKKSKVTRTIKITMRDNYFEPEKITVKEGQTVKFIVTNKGELVHEFSIGTPAEHKAHGPMMQMMVDHGVLEADKINWKAAKKMEKTMGHGMHKEGNSVLLEPGKKGTLIWKFPKHAEVQLACNVPGHYDAGMTGDVKLSH